MTITKLERGGDSVRECEKESKKAKTGLLPYQVSSEK